MTEKINKFDDDKGFKASLFQGVAAFVPSPSSAIEAAYSKNSSEWLSSSVLDSNSSFNLLTDSQWTVTSRLNDTNRQVVSLKSFEDEYNREKQKLEETTRKYKEALEDNNALKENNNALEAQMRKMEEMETLSFYKKRIDSDAFEYLRTNVDFKQKFFSGIVKATVISIDIRKSTRLMLIAKEPKKFAEFISGIAMEMQRLIIEKHGVFDKFTGDGVLAYFPEFYSGEDHVLKAIDAALAVHQKYNEYYQKHKSIFKTIPTDLGLGIGIDSGDVHLEAVNNEIYIIGDPVVYACRFGSAPATKTWANPRILDYIDENFLTYVVAEAEIKGEGNAEVYEINNVNPTLVRSIPVWKISDEESDSGE